MQYRCWKGRVSIFGKLGYYDIRLANAENDEARGENMIPVYGVFVVVPNASQGLSHNHGAA